MSAEKETIPDSFDQLYTPWVHLFEQAEAQREALLEAYNLFWNPHTVQKQWLHATSRSMDEYLRSPAFLKMMQVNMQMMITMKMFQDQLGAQPLGPISLTSNPPTDNAGLDRASGSD